MVREMYKRWAQTEHTVHRRRHKHTDTQPPPASAHKHGPGGGGTYFCLSRASRVLLLRFCRLEGGTEWTEELFLLEEWEE